LLFTICLFGFQLEYAIPQLSAIFQKKNSCHILNDWASCFRYYPNWQLLIPSNNLMKQKIKKLHQSFDALLNSGQERSIKAKKNIAISLAIKGVSICISFIMVPLTIDYINPSRYGIWLTLSSIVGWFSFFDVGLTQGLRNKFAEAK